MSGSDKTLRRVPRYEADARQGKVARIHSTRLERQPQPLPMEDRQLVQVMDGGEVALSIEDYKTLVGFAQLGEFANPLCEAPRASMEEPSDLPHVDGLGIAEIGFFKLLEGAGAHCELRVWLNNGQRLSFAIPGSKRLYWFTKMMMVFFRGDLEEVQ